MPSNVGTNQNGVDLHPANESAEFELSIVADDIEQEEVRNAISRNCLNLYF